MRRSLVVAFAALALALAGVAVAAVSLWPAGCAGAAPGSCLRVLFVGNSYTYVNDLPRTFASVARAAGHQVEVGMVAQGGATLGDLLGAPETGEALAPGRWDVVVLQEQSQVPASPQVRAAVMYPAVRSLAQRIAAAGARPVLFMTWAHRDGWADGGVPGYRAMQDEIGRGYTAIGRELGVQVVPVGAAWAMLLRTAPAISPWQEDGSHPGPAGTYLAACTFAAALLGADPVGIDFAGGLAAADARTIQEIAAGTVFGAPAGSRLP